MQGDQASSGSSSQESTATKALGPVSTLEFKTGALILERFRVIELLGRGGMGSVYKVEDVETNSIYALKFLHKQQTNDANWRRFDIEAKTANKLDHPNLIKVYETGLLPDGQPFFIMDLVEGESLADILKTRGRLTVTQAIKIFIQVGFALSYAHSNGVIHRDIKPSNIMLQRQSDDATISAVVKVVDFGIAKLTGQDEFTQQSLTKTGEIFGSPLYMSPEQCMGIGVDHRSDLYSLGCVMYEALTGAPPLLGESALSTMMKHQNEEAVSLKEASLGIDFPAQMERIVAGLLKKDLNERYQSAQLFTADLVNFDAGLESTLPVIKGEQIAAKGPVKIGKNLKLVATYASLLLLGLLIGLVIPKADDPAGAVKDSADLGTVGVAAQSNPDKFKAALPTADKVDFETSCDAQLGLLEKEPGYFSTIDQKKKLRIFNFPDFEIGDSGKTGDGRVPFRGTMTFPITQRVSFEPNHLFRSHPALFEKFRDGDLWSLIIKNSESEAALKEVEFVNADRLLQHITHLKSLQELHLISASASPEGWKMVNNLTNLNSLTLSHVQIEIPEIVKFKGFKNLVHFKLIVTEKVTPVLEQMRGSKKIYNLCLAKCNVGDWDAPILATYQNLGHLELRATEITNATIDYLPASLVTLDVRECKITRAIVPKLAHLKNLRELTVSEGIFRNEDLQRIRNTLPSLRSIDVQPTSIPIY